VIKAKKSLGQNFLIDKDIIDKITKIVKIENKNILEVGPGTGNLTSAILEKKPYKLTVIEKDEELVNFLKKKFSKQIQIINKDILDINENFLAKDTFTVFGNLPYNISTEILTKWILNLEIKGLWFDYLILMFQKEVADRIVSEYNSKNYGRLTILTNWKLDAKKIIDVKPTSFSPKPKIESSVILFKPKNKFFKLNSSKSLEKITRIFFMHRRKMIRKPYNKLFNGDKSISSKHKIDLNLRPQNLNFDTYFKLAEEYEKLIS
tara:strand:+ start:1624 stop:2412 length:789 start_codon:yes stop_codon:yes gene_type:complete